MVSIRTQPNTPARSAPGALWPAPRASETTRTCERCGATYTPAQRSETRQRFCSRECNEAAFQAMARVKTSAATDARLSADRRFRRGPAGWEKRCECGAFFTCEYNSRGQMTSRALCTSCREKRAHRSAEDLPNLDGIPRCRECSALANVEMSGFSYLDENGLCPSCARWREKRQKRVSAHVVPENPPAAPKPAQESVKGTVGGLGVPQWVIDLVMRTADCPHCGHGYAEPVLRPAVQPEHEILPPPTPAEIEAIIARVGEAHGYTPEELRSRKRDGDLCAARFECYLQLRERGLTLTDAGKAMGGRHHTTIMAAIERLASQARPARPARYDSDYSTSEAAARLGITTNDLRHWISVGRLPATSRDGRLWIPAAAVEAMRGKQ